MRLRIRGPSGQSTITLDDSSATIDTLRKEIETATSLSSYEIKYSYPPKPLVLQQHEGSKLLTDLDIKLNGEQLIINPSESASKSSSSSQPLPQPVQAVGPSKASPSTPPVSTAQSSRAQTSTSSSSAPPSAPLSLSRKPKPSINQDPPEIPVPDLGGTLVLRIMPDDNSCLFRAIATALFPQIDSMPTEMRSVIASTIRSQPSKYSPAILDNKQPNEYCRWIQSENSWGGQIEIDILSQQFDAEIISIDVQTLRVDRYNEGAARSCFIVYSGIHYDTIALSFPGGEMYGENDVKVFETPIREEVLPAAMQLCQVLQQRKYFTDTSGFNLKCEECGVPLRGERGAQDHAAKTGHVRFGEAD